MEQDDQLMMELGYTISSSCEPKCSGELMNFVYSIIQFI